MTAKKIRSIVELKGEVGAVVNIEIDAGKEKISDKKLTELLTVKREGTLDYAAIVEGERRLRNYFQEKGYFFARCQCRLFGKTRICRKRSQRNKK